MTEPKTAADIWFDAQRIAFAPLMFQAARCLLDFGVLRAVEAAGREGLSPEEAAASTHVSVYGAKVLLEAGLSLSLVRRKEDGRYRLDRTGHVLLHDELTRANFEFTRDVCYAGAERLKESIETGKPAGLRVFGDWPTIYEGLASLPPDVQKSWFGFDHHYSDRAFPEVLPRVFAARPRTLLDVGGNTGRWSLACARHDDAVALTLLDHPGQLQKARAALEAAGLGARARTVPLDLLDHAVPFPVGFDVVWMSQFLCCFAERDVVALLRRGAAALAPAGTLYVLETFWDRQSHPMGAYCLNASSLYFTAMANGVSNMYSAEDFLPLVAEAGLTVVDETDGIGVGHTLLACRPR